MKKKINIMMQAGALLAGLAITFGALGSHLLQKFLSKVDLVVFEIGVRYQFYHAVAILITASVFSQFHYKGLKWAYRFFLLGTFVFSGSLYLLSTSDWLIGIRLTWLGMITPVGGLLFIIGWLSFFLAFFMIKEKAN